MCFDEWPACVSRWVISFCRLNLPGSFLQMLFILENTGLKVLDLGGSSFDSAHAHAHSSQYSHKSLVGLQDEKQYHRTSSSKLFPVLFSSVLTSHACIRPKLRTVLRRQCKLHVFVVGLCTSGPSAFFSDQPL